jgi:hypothetical protein
LQRYSFTLISNPFSRVKSADEQSKEALETWKKCVDVQQHFNDLCLRIRNFAITVAGALLAAVGFTYQYGLEAELVGYKFAAGMGFVVAAIFAWGAFFFMDRFWYHMLLSDLPLNFHPVAIRASAVDTPFGAG